MQNGQTNNNDILKAYDYGVASVISSVVHEPFFSEDVDSILYAPQVTRSYFAGIHAVTMKRWRSLDPEGSNKCTVKQGCMLVTSMNMRSLLKSYSILSKYSSYSSLS